MKIHLSGIRVTAAVAIAAFGCSVAVGQYVPYNGVPQYGAAPYGTQPQQRPAYQPAQQQAYAPATPAQQGPYAAQPQYQPPRYQAPATGTPSQPWSQPGQAGQAGQTVQPTASQRPFGQQPYNVAMAQNDEMLPSPEPAGGSVMNGPVNNGHVMNGQQSYEGGYNNGNQGGYQDNCNCSSPYPTTGGQYNNSGYVDNGYGGYTSACGPDYGVGQYMDSSCGGPQWFGGVYYLFMTRDNPNFQPLTIQIDTGAAT